MARPKYQARLNDVVDRAVDVGIDALFERAGEFFQRTVDGQRAAMQQIPRSFVARPTSAAAATTCSPSRGSR
jgi:hypothetical protein